MSVRVPDDLPRSLAWLVGPPVVAFIWASTIMSGILSVGSSTSGLGYPFGVIYGGLAAGAGFLVGTVIRGFFRQGVHSLTVPLPLGVAVVLVLTVTGGWLGRETTRRSASDYQPAVLVDLGRLEGRTDDDTTASALAPGTLLGGGRVQDSMLWNGRRVLVRTDTTHLYVRDLDSGKAVTIPLPGIGKPFRIDVVAPRIGGGSSTAMVMMVVGSMRRDRAMLTVIDPTWQLIYQERLIRRWSIRSPAVWLWPRDDGDLVGVRIREGERRVLHVGTP